MKAIQFLIGFALLALASSLASAYDPSRLQDICVAIEDPKDGGLNKPGNTTNRLGVNETEANVEQIPGLNTLGVSAFRIDYAPNGQSPPHIHPRASEILLVLEGTLYAGFVTSDNLNNTLITKVLHEGDVFVFPIGLIHFHVNIGKTSAVAYSGLNSQFPGEITIADTIFGAHPRIKPDFLAKAFQLDPNVVKDLENKFGNGN
ncbi:Germin-like protein subfamily 1 member 17 [Citrus sinensis]|uniref:Germin-like protein subfamily 1 member 17 n=1 Tax=Citrus sinensis TaxID=2711 RepID=A0ACB8MF66_CITSI|nr:Germin-like protein subfamily 1 member 17 [Citrus sinensis]